MTELTRDKPNVDALQWLDTAVSYSLARHAATTPGAFTVGNFIRGLTSGAIASIHWIFSSTATLVNVTSGVFLDGETVNETTTGAPAGDTGNSAVLITPDAIVPQTKTEPTSGKKDLGWLYQDAPPFDEFNWRWERVWQTLDWLQGNAIRRFDELSHAIPYTQPAEHFIVQPDPINGLSDFPGALDLIQSPGLSGGASTIWCIDVDGEALVYTQDNATAGTDVHFVDPLTNSLTDPLGLGRFWSVYGLNPTHAVSPNVAICGGDVWVVSELGGNSYLTILARANGAVTYGPVQIGTATSVAPRTRSALNGLFHVLANGNRVHLSYVGGPGVYNYNHGAAVYAVDLDQDQVYIAGALSGGVAVRALTAKTYGWPSVTPNPLSAVLWNWTPVPTPFVARDICTDGEYVYVVGDHTTTGGQYNVWCLSRGAAGSSAAPTLIWSTQVDPPGSINQNALACCCDDRYLYVVVANEIVAVAKRNGAPQFSFYYGGLNATYGGVSPDRIACDGRHIWWFDGSQDYLFSGWRGLNARQFKRVAADDTVRRPNYLLAVSAEEY